jgi:hypothetical protein
MGVTTWRPSVLTRFVSIIAAVVLVDVAAVAYSSAHQFDDPPPLPAFALSLPQQVKPGVDDYAESPESFGFTMTPGRPVLPDDGHVRVLTDRGKVLDPDASLRYALAALADYSTEREGRSLAAAKTAIREVARTAQDGLLPHPLSRKDLKGEPVPKGWVSSETQGLYLSALSRLHLATGEEKWLSRADRIFDTLLRFRGGWGRDDKPYDPWLSFVDQGGYLWFEDLPQGSLLSQTMTSHFFAVLGVYDYSRIAESSRREAAVKVFLAGAATGYHYVSGLREPAYAAYTSIHKLARSWDRATVLSAQLVTLEKITGQTLFGDQAETFAGDIYVPPFATTGIHPKPGVDSYVAETAGALPPTCDQTDARLVSAIDALSPRPDTASPSALRHARTAVDRVLDTSVHGAVPHEAPCPGPTGRPMQPPWYSARTQGLLLSALTRLHALTGDRRWLDEAGAVFATMQDARTFPPRGQREAPDVWTSYVGDRRSAGNLWFEKYVPNREQTAADDLPSYALDAHLAAVIGIYDYWRTTRSPAAAEIFDGAISTVVRSIPRDSRAGLVTLTGRSTGSTRPARRSVARQLELVAEMAGRESLARYARLLASEAS